MSWLDDIAKEIPKSDLVHSDEEHKRMVLWGLYSVAASFLFPFTLLYMLLHMFGVH